MFKITNFKKYFGTLGEIQGGSDLCEGQDDEGGKTGMVYTCEKEMHWCSSEEVLQVDYSGHEEK